MTVSRPEGHPTDDELREWREWAVTQNIYKGTTEPWSPLVIAIDALLGERAAHTATKAAARGLIEDPWCWYDDDYLCHWCQKNKPEHADDCACSANPGEFGESSE